MSIDTSIRECRDELVLAGRVSAENINCSRVVLIGYIDVKGLVVSSEITVVGGGFLNFVACRNGLVVSYSKPIYINKIYCGRLYVIGSRYPVIINYGRVGELYITHSIVKELESRRLYVTRRVNVVKLSECRELFFKEPYNWIEFLNCSPGRIVLDY